MSQRRKQQTHLCSWITIIYTQSLRSLAAMGTNSRHQHQLWRTCRVEAICLGETETIFPHWSTLCLLQILERCLRKLLFELRLRMLTIPTLTNACACLCMLTAQSRIHCGPTRVIRPYQCQPHSKGNEVSVADNKILIDKSGYHHIFCCIFCTHEWTEGAFPPWVTH